MFRWTVWLLCVTACASNDEGTGDDDPADTDLPRDTDLPADTDTEDTDSPPEELDCTFEACEGDVVGDWTIDGLCLGEIPNQYADTCATSTFTQDYDVSGTFAIESDGTYQIETVTTVRVTATFPPECNSKAAVAACADWPVVLGDGYFSFTCTGDVAVACTCVQTIGPVPGIQSETWVTVGDEFHLERGDGSWNVFDTCRNGDSLVLRETTSGEQFILSR